MAVRSRKMFSSLQKLWIPSVNLLSVLLFWEWDIAILKIHAQRAWQPFWMKCDHLGEWQEVFPSRTPLKPSNICAVGGFWLVKHSQRQLGQKGTKKAFLWETGTKSEHTQNQGRLRPAWTLMGQKRLFFVENFCMWYFIIYRARLIQAPMRLNFPLWRPNSEN